MSLSDLTFQQFSVWLRHQTGVFLAPSKKSLVQQRLHRRLLERNVSSLEAYYKLLITREEESERQIAIDLLTTHETSFFREEKHYEWLRSWLYQSRRLPALRVWCAACSSGEEVWSLAMVLADCLGMEQSWQILGSDISLSMLEKAQRGHYSLQRTNKIPNTYLRRFCLRGIGRQSGTLLIAPSLRPFASFRRINLDQPLPAIGQFELIFMRNVLIYFNNDTKVQVVGRVLSHLSQDGYLVVSHSESLHGLNLALALVVPGIYRKVV